MRKYYKIQIHPIAETQAHILLSELSEIGFYAFEEEEKTLIAYINETDYNKENFEYLLPQSVSYNKEIIEEENWNEQWEKNFKPVVIDNFAAVRASFHEPVKGVTFDLLITPKMSFGTGHHATTFLMIGAMREIDFFNKKVFDFGTGTGVLAILAEKLGATQVLGTDIDEWSVVNTKENIEANNCHHIEVKLTDNLDGLDKVDVILANINLNVLTHFAERLAQCLKSNGYLLASGFLKSDQSHMVTAFEKFGFEVEKEYHKDNWMAMLFKRL